MSLCIPEKYTFLWWFSLKEVFLITKQSELNSLFYKVGNFYFGFSGLLNTMLNAWKNRVSILSQCILSVKKFSVDYFQIFFPQVILDSFFSVHVYVLLKWKNNT